MSIGYSDLNDAQRRYFDALPPHMDDRHGVDCGRSCGKCSYLRDGERRLREQEFGMDFLAEYRKTEAEVKVGAMPLEAFGYEIKPALVGLADEMADVLRHDLRRHVEDMGEHSCLEDSCGWGKAMLALNNYELYRSLMDIKSDGKQGRAAL